MGGVAAAMVGTDTSGSRSLAGASRCSSPTRSRRRCRHHRECSGGGQGPSLGPEFGSLVNRYYDPTTAQFLSQDPLVAVTGQPYQYAGDDPVNESDPGGLDWDVGGGRVLPSGGDFPYAPPRGTQDQPQRVRATPDFVDKRGRIWQWDTTHGDHWDVQDAHGKGYTRVAPDGSVLSASSVPCPSGSAPGFQPVNLTPSLGGVPGIQINGSSGGFAVAGAIAVIGGFVAANPEVLLIFAF